MKISAVNNVDVTLVGLISEFSQLDESQILLEGQRASMSVMTFLEAISGDPGKAYAMLMVILTQGACGADGELNAKERKLVDVLLAPIISANDVAIYDMFAEPLDKDSLEELRTIATKMSNSGIEGLNCALSMAKIMMAFIAIDGEISDVEIATLTKVFTETYEQLGAVALLSAMGALEVEGVDNEGPKEGPKEE